MRTPIAFVILCVAALACAGENARAPRAASLDPEWGSANPVRPLPAPPTGSPADFSLVPWVTPTKVRLGRWLFYDARLGADGSSSCASCHHPEHGFSEARPVSAGAHGRPGRRKAQPILNSAFPVYPRWFWDGRASSLVEQSKGPLRSAVETGSTLDRAAAAVAAIAAYRPYFREAFGDDRIDVERTGEAIAAYEATRLSGGSRHDRDEAGDARALGPAEIRGKELFFGRAGCKQCHLGPNLTDGQFHNLGIGWRAPPAGTPASTGFADQGRNEVTKNARDVGAFKTPTLREVSRRAPYMHDGSVKDLRQSIIHIARGGTQNPWLSEGIVPLPLSDADVDALVAFLNALDGEGYADVPPPSFPR